MKYIPFSLTALVILLDQAVKIFIADQWPLRQGEKARLISDVFNNEFLEIYHVRNTAMAFGLGHALPDSVRFMVFIVLPLGALCFLLWHYFKAKDISSLQRWTVAGILGGGIGNLIDRMFRPDGVVDFISVKFYGFLGIERFPTFNIADSSVVICLFTLLISMFFDKKPQITKTEVIS
ncbi:MAG: signal peptidase II [Treponema sp.]|nr:signal peptidase II [Treponema sp.]